MQEAIENLVQNCAQVQRGESVLLLNEQDAMDADVVGLLAEAVGAAGATPRVMWEASPERGAAMSGELLEAIASADKVIAHFPVSPSALEESLGSDPGVVVVQSMFRTKQHFVSQHARYHWGMANAIYERFQKELFAAGRKWRFASPGGTDLSGVISPFSERARQLDDNLAPFCRSFNSPAYIPVASGECEGQAVIEYTDGFRRTPLDHPPTLVIEGNVIVRVEGPPEAKRWVDQYSKILDERSERLGTADANKIDSWHGGLHPTAECIGGDIGLVGNASTRMAHFHVGPDGAHIAAQWGDLDMWLDDEKVIENGRYTAEFDDPKLREAAGRFGLSHWR